MTSSEIVHRLLNEYKEGKAYRYFECGWAKEVHMHDISETIEKDRPACVGGRVLVSYCSCAAGMLGCCNHVAGVLFRVEDAVKRGITKKSKTSVLATWNVPRTKPVMRPFKAREMSWTKSSYGKE
ncbi:hypothetical protein MAR_025427 [Mya arenaria]|uniref:SWIM-type domain-containing protein n=1 Tax=Mya arenaria TaxID=6604 RepID=A0ABY7DTL8_MYAAR|nr:hypothetical protein MAR_025427 [Mya arenaria]